MIIQKMTARFGKIDGKTLELAPGLNIVYAPNESGKSTWCAFIRAMLFGIDSSQRRRGDQIPDKTLYAPWSGTLPQGSMDVECGGLRLTLRRRSKTENAPMREFSAVYSGTEDQYPLTGTNVGAQLIGVSSDVFTRSAFIGQGAARIDNSPELETRIASIVSTGEEGLSFSEVDDALRAWQRKRRHNNRVGIIPELTEELEKLNHRLFELSDFAKKRNTLTLQLNELSQKHAELLRNLEQERVMAEAAFDEAAYRERQASVAVSAAEEAERSSREKLDSLRFGSRDPREVAQELGQAADELNSLKGSGANENSKQGRILPITFLLISLALAVFGLTGPIGAIIPAGIFLILAILIYQRSINKFKAASGATLRYREILGRYGVQSESQLSALGEEHRRLYEAWQRSAEALRGVRRALDVLRSENALRRSTLPAENTELAAVSAKLGLLREQLAELGGKADVLGDPMVIESEMSRLREAITENTAQLEQLNLARELLAEADREQHSKFSPRLTRRATELFSKMTEGRYADLSLDRALSVSARIDGDTLGHEAAFMSEGTKSLLYLALRLAICELALPENKSCPLILDDALAALDDKRLHAALNMLHEMSETRQVILFTCHRREAEYLKNRRGVNILEEI